MFKIAICGLDHWYTALGVLDIAKKSESVTLVGIEESDPMRRAWLAEKHPDVALLEDGAVSEADLVVICAPTGDAPEIAIRALEAGKHVLSVKPPAKTLAELDAVIAAAAKGLKFALAAGNESTSATTKSPASANGPNIYTVSSFAQGDKWSSFSNYGNPPVDFAEPGSAIPSTYKDGGYATLSGTSMASPHMAGLLLLGTPRSGGTVTGDPDGNPDTIGIN